MAAPKENKVSVEYEHAGARKLLSGAKEGEYVRLSKEDIQHHPEIVNLTKQGDMLNNVWLIFTEHSGNVLRKGQELRARVRVNKKTGGFAIAATVTLGIVVAVKAIQRSRE
jgi:hypothetical protein